ncbi:MAG: cyclic pyranopterin monophosphate synthase MoaC [Woeseiaceae bacterium]
MSKLSHVNADNQPTMVDVSHKEASVREAHAQTIVQLPDEIVQHISGKEIGSKKGPVFATAVIAGVMAAKKTHELIPFCHPIGLDDCSISIGIQGNDAVIDCRCKVRHKTGVEMEALTGASVAALTVYDMLKAMSHDIVIANTRLMAKSGGKQDFQRDE